MKNNKNPLWKQTNPKDQFIAIMMAVEGIESNYENDIYDAVRAMDKLLTLHHQLNELLPYLTKEKEWNF